MGLVLLLLALRLAASSSQHCDRAGDKWVLVDPSTGATVIDNSGMPELPSGTRSVSYGVKRGRYQGYDGTIVIAGPLSLSPSDEFYAYAKLMRHSLEIFADIVNHPTNKCVHEALDGSCTLHGLGGIRVGEQRMALYFEWAGDGSSTFQVNNATLQATRSTCANFTIAGYASSLTLLTAQQSFYDNRVMLAPAAAATSVYTQEINGRVSNLSFGLAIPSSQYHRTALDLLRETAMRKGHLDELVLGFVQASTDFTTTMCTGAVEYAKELGLTVATGRRSIQRDASTWSHDTDEDADLVYTVAKVMHMCMYMYITWEQRRGGAWRL